MKTDKLLHGSFLLGTISISITYIYTCIYRTVYRYMYIDTSLGKGIFWDFRLRACKTVGQERCVIICNNTFFPRSWWFCTHPEQQHCKPTALKGKPKKNRDLKRATCEEHGIHLFSHDFFFDASTKSDYMPSFYTFLGTNKCCLKGGFPLFSGEENSSPSKLNHPPATCPAKKLAPPSHRFDRDRERERFKGRGEIMAVGFADREVDRRCEVFHELLGRFGWGFADRHWDFLDGCFSCHGLGPMCPKQKSQLHFCWGTKFRIYRNKVCMVEGIKNQGYLFPYS